MNRMSYWHGLIKELEAFLPDMTIPFNFMDETRLLVPFEKINEMMKVEAQNRTMPAAANVLSNFSVPKNENMENDQSFDAQWNGDGIGANQYWDLAKLACPPALLPSISRRLMRPTIVWTCRLDFRITRSLDMSRIGHFRKIRASTQHYVHSMVHSSNRFL